MIVLPTTLLVAHGRCDEREEIRLKELFDRFDTDGSKELSTSELGRFLRAMLPGCKPAQERYFQTMLDVDNDGQVTYVEMVDALRECMSAGEKAAIAGGNNDNQISLLFCV